MGFFERLREELTEGEREQELTLTPEEEEIFRAIRDERGNIRICIHPRLATAPEEAAEIIQRFINKLDKNHNE